MQPKKTKQNPSPNSMLYNLMFQKVLDLAFDFMQNIKLNGLSKKKLFWFEPIWPKGLRFKLW